MHGLGLNWNYNLRKGNMFIKQLSVFLENREGRLEDVLRVLKNNKVNVVSLSLADTQEFGILRLLVDKVDMAYSALQRNGFSARVTDVLAVKVAHQVGMLQELLAALGSAHINVEYMYALSVWEKEASIILKTSDLALAGEILHKNGAGIVKPDEIGLDFKDREAYNKLS